MEDEEAKKDEEGGKEGGKEGGRVETCYRHLIQAHPSYDRAYVNLGGYYYIKGDMEKAAALYMKALEVNPENAIATHALGALQGEKLEGASLDYLSELFDSYSATFDASLHALEYKSPELLRRAVDGYLGSPEGKELAPEVSFLFSLYHFFSDLLFLVRLA
jgi:predicted TPR repeat methyltransferase